MVSIVFRIFITPACSIWRIAAHEHEVPVEGTGSFMLHHSVLSSSENRPNRPRLMEVAATSGRFQSHN